MPGRKSYLQQLLLSAFAVAVLRAPDTAAAQGEHARRVAAELLVMRGDLRKLSNKPAAAKRHQKGLRNRLRGGLAGLDILLRLANQETLRLTEPTGAMPSAAVNTLRQALNQQDLTAFKAKLSQLVNRYPLATTGILLKPPLRANIKTGQKIHNEHCAGCHDSPDTDTQRPAYNLFAEAKAMPPTEFAARMILGVRGDRVTGISNPLTDSQIAALIAYYRAGNQRLQ